MWKILFALKILSLKFLNFIFGQLIFSTFLSLLSDYIMLDLANILTLAKKV
jgi:hypothetical protein